MYHVISHRLALATLAASLFMGAALLSGCDNPPDTIKIGVAQPLTGNLAALGQDLHNGVKLAVAELNKEGFKIKGKPVTIEIVAMDDRSDAATGKQVAQQLVDAGVVAVIGNLNSGVSIESAPIYATKDIAQLAISTNPKFTQLGLATTYRLVANDMLQAKAIGSFAANQLKAAKYAVLDDGTPYGKGLAEGAADQLKLAEKEITLRQSFDDKTTAFDELAAKLKQDKVEVVITTLNDFQVLALLEALKKADYTQLSILGGDTIKTPTMLKGIGMVKGLYATSPILDAKEFVNGKVFLAKYLDAYKVEPAYGGHYTYDAMYVLAGAMRRANSVQPKKITETLRSFDGYAPVTGSMKWDGVGEQRYGVVGVYAARKGAWDLQLRSDRW
ncbi:branched-chain amino acid ABC transporter substrate-binding protein [Polaromonas sp.]|uniref:branched-chain amino acid ABC transporter substrate-binding protein n=1 Tax=Polaromonas sp. TaxID=1869339 RepID=UPI00286D43DF|nr:branched-chain amino acid ABC transporter substrate-binding protein [Polaromonas sp.]